MLNTTPPSQSDAHGKRPQAGVGKYCHILKAWPHQDAVSPAGMPLGFLGGWRESEMRTINYVILAAMSGLSLFQVGRLVAAAQSEQAPTQVTDQVRAELLSARDSAWRAFFSDDPGRLEGLLGPELIAIQQHQENWENRDQLLTLARGIQRHGVRIARLEFPHTEIQVFGDVAILYYTYIFATTDGARIVTDSGRGTEFFVRRDGRWVDVGWHLDNGAFVRRGETWVRVSANAIQSP